MIDFLVAPDDIIANGDNLSVAELYKIVNMSDDEIEQSYGDTPRLKERAAAAICFFDGSEDFRKQYTNLKQSMENIKTVVCELRLMYNEMVNDELSEILRSKKWA